MEGNIEILNLGMKPGNTLKVKGKISADALGFSINLGSSSRDLAFHFNPRFNESVIVCNSKYSDSWQTEQRDCHLPFFRGCTVKFFIEMLSDRFRVKLPDGYEVYFPNRHGYHKINYISIAGGLKMISLKLS
ncbi:galectin-2 isoform X1 [Hirundo rustica]|uniref:galectin-2 isoform X1 n=1 Tax=Hirundo rustica TaxID=43150 RepID=UPI001A9512EB|nr:galectin-2 isoform X1 [Hirundo rustica]